LLALLFFLVAALLLSCQAQNSGPSPTSLPAAELADTTWTMTSMAGAKVLAGSEITAGFFNGQLSGSTGCNNYFYDYQTATETIRLAGGGVTEMACQVPQGVMAQAERFLDYLNQVRTFHLTSDTLQLITTGGDRLIFGRRP
jgi:heat shock protein HslJ